MKPRKPTLAAFTAMIGMLALILTVSVLAEKAHEAHLPERNGRAHLEVQSPFGLPLGIALLLSSVSGFAGYRHRNRSGTAQLRGNPGCTMKTLRFAREWPMRLHYSQNQENFVNGKNPEFHVL